ncbi:MAG: hypothetical protein KAI47_16995, partial [Deltaproteobacteria bacterium]|nr:hypothetical protein [Deltaproteobacteria bacterium]
GDTGTHGDTGTDTGVGTWDCRDPWTGGSCILGQGSGCLCDKTDPGRGLPPGGENWKCNRVNMGGEVIWMCYGEVPLGETAPGGRDWDCDAVSTEKAYEIWRCRKPDGPEDRPAEGGNYGCVKGSEFKGTRCEEVYAAPFPVLDPTCVPGSKMWCDGLQYSGWGQATCKPDGTWATKTYNGKMMLDCKEVVSWRRPNTVCACYHFYFNPACCERSDCIVPQGSMGQICPKSAGKLCDYCNPANSECGGPGAHCIVTNTMESFCGKACASASDCPSGYGCLVIPKKAQKQCVPLDFSCYY